MCARGLQLNSGLEKSNTDCKQLVIGLKSTQVAAVFLWYYVMEIGLSNSLHLRRNTSKYNQCKRKVANMGIVNLSCV